MQTLINLGVIAVKREQPQEAINFFTQALAFDNNNIEARSNLAATFIHNDRFENALTHYEILLKEKPNNIEYLYNVGVAQMALGHLKEADAKFKQVLNLDSKHFAALNNLAALNLRLNKKENTIRYLKDALAIKPHDSATKYMLNALNQGKENIESSEYVKNLFNNYAHYYDSHMQNTLHYKLPNKIAQILHKVNFKNFVNTLDLGCGTGLSGIVLREISQKLTGVDISKKMLSQASAKNIYDDLYETDIIEFLKKDTNHYELIVAADVLPYIGNLEPLFLNIKSHLLDNGLFVFSYEICEDEKDFKVQSTLRFCHNQKYIEKLINQNNLEIVYQEKILARVQDNKDLPVMLTILSKKE